MLPSDQYEFTDRGEPRKYEPTPASVRRMNDILNSKDNGNVDEFSIDIAGVPSIEFVYYP